MHGLLYIGLHRGGSRLRHLAVATPYPYALHGGPFRLDVPVSRVPRLRYYLASGRRASHLGHPVLMHIAPGCGGN